MIKQTNSLYKFDWKLLKRQTKQVTNRINSMKSSFVSSSYDTSIEDIFILPHNSFTGKKIKIK